jgi:hypothetical protein
MTFHLSLEAAEQDSPFNTHDVCMCCGKKVVGPLIGYDLTLPNSDILTRALFHRDCAFAMAQRIIMDAWPNRRAGEWMKNDR